MIIPDKLKKEILSHAKSTEPQECCGFVVFKDGFSYIPCGNISHDPVNFFEISPDDFLLAEERGVIVALVHSHPDSAF